MARDSCWRNICLLPLVSINRWSNVSILNKINKKRKNYFLRKYFEKPKESEKLCKKQTKINLLIAKFFHLGKFFVQKFEN